MTDPKVELSRTSEGTLDLLREIEDLEHEKRAQQIGSPEFLELGRTVTDKSRELATSVRRQERLGDESTKGRESIEDVDDAEL